MPLAPQQLTELASRIELVVFDVDGVMTDGRLYLGPEGSEFKTMHVRDGLGLKRLQAMGITPAVISGRPSRPVEDRLLALGLQYIYMAVDDKRPAFSELCETLGVAPTAAAVMGDDLPDLQIMETAGLALAVSDAVDEVLAAADWVSQRAGGHGAVREACDMLISAREAAR
jgi:3-deoxy-D-manno-octulosonate 8-phosphate phosphatase (KDO 8-P phosphatase)